MKVTVVDYGMGNLYSVCRAVEHCGGDPVLAADAAGVRGGGPLILPGVGAFGDAMAELRRRALVEPIREAARNGRPLLGICLGMQMLLDSSEEFGEHEGLGLIPGAVRAIPDTDGGGRPLKVPQVGWNALTRPEGARWEDTPLGDVRDGDSVYFVHSFAASPARPEHRLADCLYGGHALGAAVADGGVLGCQFHPEKSGPVGLRILERFIHG